MAHPAPVYFLQMGDKICTDAEDKLKLLSEIGRNDFAKWDHLDGHVQA